MSVLAYTVPHRSFLNVYYRRQQHRHRPNDEGVEASGPIARDMVREPMHGGFPANSVPGSGSRRMRPDPTPPLWVSTPEYHRLNAAPPYTPPAPGRLKRCGRILL